MKKEADMPQGRNCAIVLLLLGFSAAASGQTWPSKSIRALVPYSAGSASDIIPRTVFAAAEKQLGQPIIVENRGGGGSIIGTAAVAKAAPDGYTILSTSSAFTIVPVTVANLSYDPLLDFAAVIPLANMANVLVVSPAKGIKTVGDLVAYARAHPNAMNYVTIGTGSAAHLNSERFRLSAHFEAQPVSYKGSPEGLLDVMTGRVDFYFSPLLPALPMIRSGSLLALAVSSARRDPQLPDVPTTLELGFTNSEYNFWFGVFAPSKTPPPIITRLHDEIAAALEDASVREKLRTLGVQPMSMSPGEFETYVRQELEENKALVSAIGIKAE
jgi:tripartite-type tricarboxylate transporter receptor subunit TctC